MAWTHGLRESESAQEYDVTRLRSLAVTSEQALLLLWKTPNSQRLRLLHQIRIARIPRQSVVRQTGKARDATTSARSERFRELHPGLREKHDDTAAHDFPVVADR
jgi:hypothetical protein